jgi:hypothetical protein
VERHLGWVVDAIKKIGAEPVFIRSYKAEVVLLRALLKGTTKKQLLQLKQIVMDRYVDNLEVSADKYDNEMYLSMATATRIMITNCDIWIPIFGN